MAILRGNLDIAFRDDGSGGNLTVAGILSCGGVDGLSLVQEITGDGVTTDFHIVHNLESLALVTAMYDADGNQIDALVICTSLNNVVVSFGVVS